MNQERVEFGARLKVEREARSLSLTEVARVTRIPQRTLERLEDGAFEELPAEVFVRGFLRSYCRQLGLDVDSMLRRYGELARCVEVSSPSLAGKPQPPPPVVEEAPPPPPSAEEHHGLISQALAEAERGTRRMSLTLAVIILVIVATLTLSFLLRRPSHVGDGLSQLPAATERSAS